MVSQEKLKISTTLQILPTNVGGLGKIIVAKGLEMLPNLVTLTMRSSWHVGQPTYRHKHR